MTHAVIVAAALAAAALAAPAASAQRIGGILQMRAFASSAKMATHEESAVSSGCGDHCMKARTKEIKDLLKKALIIGDSREKVGEVLTNAGIVYEYDRFQNRYQSTVFDPQCGSYEAISIYVYFDSKQKMSTVEIFESHTAP